MLSKKILMLSSGIMLGLLCHTATAQTASLYRIKNKTNVNVCMKEGIVDETFHCVRPNRELPVTINNPLFKVYMIQGQYRAGGTYKDIPGCQITWSEGHPTIIIKRIGNNRPFCQIIKTPMVIS